MILIIEKRTSENSRELKNLIHDVCIENFETPENLERILLTYATRKKNEIKLIIFHASGRDGVTVSQAKECLKKILEWKSPAALLRAVSEGEDYRSAMLETIREVKAQNAKTDSYNNLVGQIREKLNQR